MTVLDLEELEPLAPPFGSARIREHAGFVAANTLREMWPSAMSRGAEPGPGRQLVCANPSWPWDYRGRALDPIVQPAAARRAREKNSAFCQVGMRGYGVPILSQNGFRCRTSAEAQDVLASLPESAARSAPPRA